MLIISLFIFCGYQSSNADRQTEKTDQRPSILSIMSDDHAQKAIIKSPRLGNEALYRSLCCQAVMFAAIPLIKVMRASILAQPM